MKCDTLTSSRESEGSPLPQGGQDLKRLPSAKSTCDVEPSSKERGACQSSPTSGSLMAESTQASLFLPEAHHVSLQVEPGSREAKQMTVGSGAKLCACLRKQSRIASFSRTLLESSTWGSTEYFLRWEGSATKCNRSIFRLVPWIRLNSDTESGLSGSSYPTPRGSDAEKAGPNQTQHGEPALAQIAASWPTLHGTAKEGAKRRQGPTANELGNLVTRTAATWPTPQSRDEKGETQNAHRMDAVPNVLKASWPTPKAIEGIPTGKNAQGGLSLTSTLAIGKTPYGCLAQMESFVERLTNLSMWLMGYTAHYLQGWETRSCRKSPTKSSVQSKKAKPVSEGASSCGLSVGGEA